MTHQARFVQFVGGRGAGQRDLWHSVVNTLDLCAACAAEMTECDKTAIVEPITGREVQ